MNRILNVLLVTLILCPSVRAEEIELKTGQEIEQVEVQPEAKKEISFVDKALLTTCFAGSYATTWGLEIGFATIAGSLGMSLVEKLSGNTYNRDFGPLFTVSCHHGVKLIGYSFIGIMGSVLSGSLFSSRLIKKNKEQTEKIIQTMESVQREAKILAATTILGVLAYKYYNA